MVKYCSECGNNLKEEFIRKQNYGRKYNILGIIFAFGSLVIFPIGFGPATIIFGTVGLIKGDRALGAIVIFLGVIFTVLSIIIAMYFLSEFGIK